MIPLTTSGKSVCAAISPDGKYVAHAEEKDGLQQLLVTGIVTAGSPVAVASPAKTTYHGITFSRDGNSLYFTRSEEGEVGVLYQIALPAGVPRKIKEGVDGAVTFSPSGDRFAFVRFKEPAASISDGGKH